jgi:hypothetical protein
MGKQLLVRGRTVKHEPDSRRHRKRRMEFVNKRCLARFFRFVSLACSAMLVRGMTRDVRMTIIDTLSF